MGIIAKSVLQNGNKIKFRTARGITQNPKENVDKKLTPKEAFVYFATGFYEAKTHEQARKMLEIKLNEKTAAYNANPTPESLRDKEEAELKLEVFDETIRKLKAAEAKEETNLLKNITEAEEKVAEAEKEVKKAIDDLIANLEKGDKDAILNSINAFKTAYDKHSKCLENMTSKIKEYNEKNEAEQYVPKYKEIKLTSEQTEKIYKGLAKQRSLLINSKKIFGGIGNYKYTTAFQGFIADLPNYFGDADKFKEIHERVDKELAEENKSPKEKALEEIQEKIKKSIEEMFEQHTKEITALSALTVDEHYFHVSTTIGNIIDDYVKTYKFKKAEVEKIITDAVSTFKDKEKEKYGEHFVKAVREIIKIKEAITKLNELEYDGNEENFKKEQDKVISLIQATKDSKVLKDAGITLKYYENIQRINIDFNGKLPENVNINILKDEIIKKLLTGPKPAVNPIKKATETAEQKLETKLNELLGSNPTKPSEADAKKALEEILDEFKELTPELKENLINKYLEKFKTAPIGKTLDEELKEVKTSTFEYFKKAIRDFKTFIKRKEIYLEISSSMTTILDKNPRLSKDEKEEIIKKVIDEIEATLNKEYSKEFIDGYNQAYELKQAIEELAKIDYKDEKFNGAYEALITKIKTVGASETVTKAGIKVELNEEDLALRITFDNGKVDLVSMYIVSEAVRKEMKKKPEEKDPKPVTPPIDEEAEKEKNEAIKQYLEILKELRDEIRRLNHANKTIEANAEITFDTITSDRVLNLVKAEKVAEEHEVRLLEKRLELSNARANLRLKHNCYITTIQEVKEFEMPKVEFGKDYIEFIEHYDGMIGIAEGKILELDRERKADYTPESRIEELTNQMKELAKYIETVNSLIGRRIVAASVENDIDIVALLAKRAQDKAAIRVEIQKALAQRVEAKPKVDEEVEERKLTEALTVVYDKWLKQLEFELSSKTITVDEESFKREVQDIVDKSPASKKYRIAEDLKNTFETQKERMIKEYQEKEFQEEVYRIFGGEILKTISLIRNGADYKTDFENLCINTELKDKLIQLSASSNLTNKEAIIEEGKNKYLGKIKEIIDEEKIKERRALQTAVETAEKTVETHTIDEDFELRVKAVYETVKISHQTSFTTIEMNYDFDNNKISVHYPYKEYNGKAYDSKIGKFTRELMPQKMHEQYLAMKAQRKPVVKDETPEEAEKRTEQEILKALQALSKLTLANEETLTKILAESENWPKEKVTNIITILENRGIIQINADGSFTKVEPKPSKSDEQVHADDPQLIPDIKVNNSKRLKFVSTNPQVINRFTGKILTADEIQLTLMTNGLKIKYSENLRTQLQALNAKLSLVHKETYQRRKTIDISGKEKEEIFANPKKGEEFDPVNYRIEIRTDKMDKNGQKTGRTEAVFKMDIDEELADELKAHKSL